MPGPLLNLQRLRSGHCVPGDARPAEVVEDQAAARFLDREERGAPELGRFDVPLKLARQVQIVGDVEDTLSALRL